MKIPMLATWVALGMSVASAGAFAVPLPAHPARIRAAASDPPPHTGGVLSRFNAGDTLMIDARLGHESIAEGARGDTFLFASVTGADAPASEAPPMNLAIVIDRSGSMAGERIANAIAAATAIVHRLRDKDSVSVIAFDSDARVVVPRSVVASGERAGIESAIRSIRVGGDTCMSCGLSEGMRSLDDGAVGGDRVNRMILLSDGAANRGITDVPGLRRLAGRMRDRGCAISTVGVDVDFDEKVMAAIAVESNGRHYFAAEARAVTAIFDQELESLRASIARDAELTVDVPSGVVVDEVLDRAFHREGSRIVVPLGTFSAGQEKTVLARMRVPSEKQGPALVASVHLRYRDLVQRRDTSSEGELSLFVTSADRAQRDLDPFVAARVERSRTARTLTDANRLFEQGDVDQARARLAEHTRELRASESRNLAAAKAAPASAPRSGRALDSDFEEQLAAVTAADSSFAPAPRAVGAGGGSASGASAAPAPPSKESHEGKAAVRANQSAATNLAF